MLIIPTPLGDAIRSCEDVVDADSGVIRLKPEASCTFLREPLLRSSVPVSMYSCTDLPDPHRVRTEISNVCGFVAGGPYFVRIGGSSDLLTTGLSTLCDRHPAWRTVRSTLGCFREAYSLRAGNLLFLRGKLIFKGATSREGVYSTVSRLVSEPSTPVLKAYLIIATAYMRRNLFVHNGCLLEEMLSRFSWCRVMMRFEACIFFLPSSDDLHRHEEMSNAVIFYINSWDSFRLSQGRAKPDMGTVTVSRRGVVNVRLGWHDGVDWEGNEEWVALVDSVRDFLLTLC